MIACDEFFVTLTDGFQQTMVLMLDVASRLTVTYPIRRATLSITSEEFQEALERAWLPWAGHRAECAWTRPRPTWRVAPRSSAGATARRQT